MMKLIFGLFIVMLAGTTEAQFELSQQGERISLEITDERLGNVLAQVSRRLALDVPDLSRVQTNESVNLSMRGDAEAVLSRLLRNYNHIFKYDQDGNLKGITILGRKSSDVGPVEDIAVPEPPPEPVEEE